MMKFVYYLLISFVLVLLNQSVLLAFIPSENLNILLVSLVFVTFVWGFDTGFIFAVFIGFLLNLYSYLPLGTYILVFILIIGLVDFLHKQVFINFTFSTNIILIVLSTLFYSFLLTAINFILYFLGFISIYISIDKMFLTNLFWQIVSNSIFICLIFIFAKAIFKKLNLAILAKR